MVEISFGFFGSFGSFGLKSEIDGLTFFSFTAKSLLKSLSYVFYYDFNVLLHVNTDVNTSEIFASFLRCVLMCNSPSVQCET